MDPKDRAGIRSLIITPEILPTTEEFLSTNEVVGKSRQALEQRIDRIMQWSGLLCPLPECDIRHKAGQNMSAPSLAYVMGWNSLEASENYLF